MIVFNVALSMCRCAVNTLRADGRVICEVRRHLRDAKRASLQRAIFQHLSKDEPPRRQGTKSEVRSMRLDVSVPWWFNGAEALCGHQQYGFPVKDGHADHVALTSPRQRGTPRHAQGDQEKSPRSRVGRFLRHRVGPAVAAHPSRGNSARRIPASPGDQRLRIGQCAEDATLARQRHSKGPARHQRRQRASPGPLFRHHARFLAQSANALRSGMRQTQPWPDDPARDRSPRRLISAPLTPRTGSCPCAATA